jgi:outer membrane receptor protein involved in Fe transport
MNKFFTKLLVALTLSFLVSSAFAQTGVGKISGNVMDADTREPLIGANVIVLGTNHGAATDIEGNYFILNITPGTYDVKFSYVGYASKTLQGVRIVANITYELNVDLSTDFTLPEIVVEDKKFFEQKATNTVKVIDSDQISRLPIRGVSNIASLQSGVVVSEGSGGQDGDSEINVRGGRGSEVLYIVDGVPQNNLYNRDSEAQVSNVAIDQISFQVGGYEAKYGQAQSGIVNVTTKSGQQYYSILADVVTSEFTDDYGYNLYSGVLSGPIIPGIAEHTIFLSGERGWFKDADPMAVPIELPSLADETNPNGVTLTTIPNNSAGIWRFSGKTKSRFGNWSVQLGALINERVNKRSKNINARGSSYYIRFYKNNSAFFPEFERKNYSFSGRVSQTVSNSTFWNLNLGYREFEYELYQPQLRSDDPRNPTNHVNDLMSYGDSTLFEQRWGVTLLANGTRIADEIDDNGVYYSFGYMRGLYQHREDDVLSADLDLTSQLDNHLLEFGAGIAKHTVRGYGINAFLLAGQEFSTNDSIFAATQPYVFGYDMTGANKTTSSTPANSELLGDLNEFLRPREPILAYIYLQDRFELDDIVLNFGLRMDYFDVKSFELINPEFPYLGGSDPDNFDRGDFKVRDAKVHFSPRLGIGFPVTESTVFHAQYGRFIQLPELNDMYTGPYDYDQFVTGSPQFGQNGGLLSEETTQYEIGLRQLLGPNSALNITAFYKNTRDLVNVQNHEFQRSEGGEIITAIYSANADFGTIKGFALSFDVTRLSYLSASLQYTFSIAEGTGSSINSSQTAVFRNLDGLPPKVIAPLNFDQTHTGVAILDFYVPEGELGFLELFNINAIISFNSGRPYTPVDQWNAATNDNGIVAATTGYVNSAVGPSTFRIDLKVEKSFPIGDFYITPYIWIENLLDVDNEVAVWRTTGNGSNTDWLNTETGRAVAENNGPGYVQDYKSLEKDPRNFGIPRLIKLGLKLNFSKIGL